MSTPVPVAAPAAAPVSPKGSANWVSEAEAYIKALEADAVLLWKDHQVYAFAAIAFIAGLVIGLIF